MGVHLVEMLVVLGSMGGSYDRRGYDKNGGLEVYCASSWLKLESLERLQWYT